MGLLVGAILLFLVSVKLGAVSIPLSQMADILLRGEQPPQQRILPCMRIPRTFVVALAGMGLTASGAAIQTVLGNSLADPNIIGVNAGAEFAMVLCGPLFPGTYGMLPLATFVGVFIVVIFIYFLVRYADSPEITLVLSGVAVNSLLNTVIDTIYTFDADSLVRSSGFHTGGLSGVNTFAPVPVGIAIVIVVAVAASLHDEIETLPLGDASAKALGLPVTAFQFLLLALAAVLVGASVSSAGLLGFMELIVSYTARMMVGDECEYFIVTSILLGALLVMNCDLAARMVLAPYELPVGIVPPSIGTPFFIWLLTHQRRRGSCD